MPYPLPLTTPPGFVYKRGGGILDKTHPPNFGPTHPTLDPPRPPPPYNSVGSIFLQTKLKPRRSPGLGIPAPKGDTYSKKETINMQVNMLPYMPRNVRPRR